MRKVYNFAFAVLGNLLLFITAYVPLLWMFAALLYSETPTLSITLLVSGVAALLVCAISLYMSHGRSTQNARVLSISSSGDSAMTYLATYILPFVTGVPETRGEWLAAGIYGVTLFIIFSKTDVKAVNPALFLVGLSISKMRVDTETATIDAVHCCKVKVGDSVRISRFGGAHSVRKAPRKPAHEHD